ncbi:MAG: ImmA/IrrE family metallo-endopeptidase [Clostridiales bacterium]|nr:ImmA/IrrE family metallo-endopeptidase [Clostridiales bacterium]
MESQLIRHREEVIRLTIEMIAKAANNLKKKYGESDPFQLARDMKIILSLEPMGTYDGCCKGFFITHRRKKHITINCDLPDILQKVVLSHEIGHCVLHTSKASGATFHEVTLFDETDAQEYEANVFASELLLSDDAVLSVLNDDMFFFQAASTLYVPFELLDFKFRILKRRGYKIESPVVSNGDFLKNLKRDADKIFTAGQDCP